jgi:choline kinase
MAGGASVRFPPYSGDMPKCLATIGGIPIIVRHLQSFAAMGSGLCRIIISVKSAEAYEQVRKRLAGFSDIIVAPTVHVNEHHASGVLPAFASLIREYHPESTLTLALSDMILSPSSLHGLPPFRGPGIRLLTSSDQGSRTGSVVQRRTSGDVEQLTPVVEPHVHHERWCGIVSFGSDVVAVLAHHITELTAHAGATVIEEDLINLLLRSDLPATTIDIGPCVNANTAADLDYAQHLLGMIQ